MHHDWNDAFCTLTTDFWKRMEEVVHALATSHASTDAMTKQPVKVYGELFNILLDIPNHTNECRLMGSCIHKQTGDVDQELGDRIFRTEGVG
uniref:Uncharacterized protein n=1 Tax=Zea mays TaxID=4577 RepID=A0A804QBL8_MAIZE